MTVPVYSKDLDGILCIGGVQPVPGTLWSVLLAPDGTNTLVTVDPLGHVTTSSPADPGPYQSFIISPDGAVGSVMPARSGGPQPGARWMNYALIVVPTSGL